MLRIDLIDYAKKQIKFSFGNLFSIPVGTAMLYLLTQYGHIWYIYSSLLGLVVTTAMNFAIQILLGVVKIDKKPEAPAKP